MKNQILKVEGMSCNHCVHSIESALEEIGVAAKVDLKNATVEVQYDEVNVTEDKIKLAIEEQGYDIK